MEISREEINGDDVRVPIDDIAAISRFVKVDSNDGTSSGSACSPGSTCDIIGEVRRRVGLFLLPGLF